MPETNADISAEEKADKAAVKWFSNITNRVLCETLVKGTGLSIEEIKAFRHIYKAGYVQAMEDDAMTALLASTGGE